MNRHLGEHGRYCFQSCLNERKKNEVRSRTSNYCVLQKKSAEWVNSYLSQKQIEKSQ